jgi:NAD(P)-dependent dehydrogenase (short-subunit alcohol dehydrogenase family)
MARFTDSRILITGGTSGIGLAGARRIQAEGGMVAVTGMNADRVTASGAEIGGDGFAIANDASDPVAATSLADAVARWGKLDGLWLNAGYADLEVIEAVDAEFFDRMMNANVRGPVLQVAKLSPLLNDGASIVITSSVSPYEGLATTGTYAATKGALIALARSWAAAFAPRNIRVNALVPGPIESRLRDFLTEADRAAFEENALKSVPLGRVGTAEEAAAVALFLLSSDASYVTGSQYFVDGGMMMI